MGLWKNIKKKIDEYKLNRRIAQTKCIHLMFNDKFNKTYVDFLNSNFDPNEHLILLQKIYPFPPPEGDNVVEIKNMKHLNFNGKKTEKVLFHSLFNEEFINYLYAHSDILREKAYWIIWGGDLYDAPKDEKNDFVRKNFKGYVSSITGDEEVAQKKYQSNAALYSAPYGNPLDNDILKKARNNIVESEKVHIQINNSADETTLSALDVLAKFKDENIVISTILSYGQTEYKDEIIAKGREIFGNKFEYIDQYMPPQEYADHMANIDILILFQNRQQGCGNVFAAAYLGKKIFIKSEVTTFTFWLKNNITVHDSNLINEMTFDELIAVDQNEKNNNIKNAVHFYESNKRQQAWGKLFND